MNYGGNILFPILVLSHSGTYREVTGLGVASCQALAQFMSDSLGLDAACADSLLFELHRHDG